MSATTALSSSNMRVSKFLRGGDCETRSSTQIAKASSGYENGDRAAVQPLRNLRQRRLFIVYKIELPL